MLVRPYFAASVYGGNVAREKDQRFASASACVRVIVADAFPLPADDHPDGHRQRGACGLSDPGPGQQLSPRKCLRGETGRHSRRGRLRVSRPGFEPERASRAKYFEHSAKYRGKHHSEWAHGYPVMEDVFWLNPTLPAATLWRLLWRRKPYPVECVGPAKPARRRLPCPTIEDRTESSAPFSAR